MFLAPCIPKCRTARLRALWKTDDPAITQDFIDENNFSKKTSKTSQISSNMVMGNVSFNFYF